MLKGFPKEVTLKNGKKVILKPFAKEDEEKLYRFFCELPMQDRMFLKHDVTQRDLIKEWAENINFQTVLPILAVHGERIVADGTLHRWRHGWLTHVGEMRLVIATDFRGTGLSRAIAKEIYLIAVKAGLERIVSQMVREQVKSIKIFEKLGFRKEAVLKNHVKDLSGIKRDLVFMINDLSALWEQLQDWGGVSDTMIDEFLKEK